MIRLSYLTSSPNETEVACGWSKCRSLSSSFLQTFPHTNFRRRSPRNATPLHSIRLLAEHPPDDPGVDTGGDTRVVRCFLSFFLSCPCLPRPSLFAILPWLLPGSRFLPRRLFFDLRLLAFAKRYSFLDRYVIASRTARRRARAGYY